MSFNSLPLVNSQQIWFSAQDMCTFTGKGVLKRAFFLKRQ